LPFLKEAALVDLLDGSLKIPAVAGGDEFVFVSDVKAISKQQRMPNPIAPTIAIRVTLGKFEKRFPMILAPSYDCNNYSNTQESLIIAQWYKVAHAYA
jgi:hypothetical protein